MNIKRYNKIKKRQVIKLRKTKISLEGKEKRLGGVGMTMLLNKSEYIKKLYNQGGKRKMGVSMGVMPILKGKDADRINREIKTSKTDNEFLHKCSELSKKLREGKINR